MSLFLLNVVVVQLPGLWLLDLIGQCEVALADLLRGNDLRVVHIYFVHTIVSLRPNSLYYQSLPI
jgi:hypothetical protein